MRGRETVIQFALMLKSKIAVQVGVGKSFLGLTALQEAGGKFREQGGHFVFYPETFPDTDLFCSPELTAGCEALFSIQILPMPFIVFVIACQQFVCALSVQQYGHTILFGRTVYRILR